MSQIPAITSQRERNRLRTRNDIMDAAAQLLSDGGYAGTALEKIAGLAGIARGTIYAHFPGGREEIVRAVYLRLAEAVLHRGAELREEAEGLVERTRALARALTEASADPRGRFYGIMGPDLAPVLAGVTGTASRSFENFLRDDLILAQQEGRLVPGADTDALANTLNGALRAAGTRAATDPEAVEAQIHAIGLLAAGLLRPEETSTNGEQP